MILFEEIENNLVPFTQNIHLHIGQIVVIKPEDITKTNLVFTEDKISLEFFIAHIKYVFADRFICIVNNTKEKIFFYKDNFTDNIYPVFDVCSQTNTYMELFATKINLDTLWK